MKFALELLSYIYAINFSLYSVFVCFPTYNATKDLSRVSSYMLFFFSNVGLEQSSIPHSDFYYDLPEFFGSRGFKM